MDTKIDLPFRVVVRIPWDNIDEPCGSVLMDSKGVVKVIYYYVKLGSNFVSIISSKIHIPFQTLRKGM